MKVVIMAGGKGTRIASIRSDIPKPMIEICKKPILEWQIENLRAYGLIDITLVIGYKGKVIQEYFGDGSRWGVNINYFVESNPLGTAGALFQIKDLTQDFILLCGDVIIDVDFHRFINFHFKHHALASLMAHPNSHPYDSSLLVTEILPPLQTGGLPKDSHRVIKWLNKEDDREYYQNRINAGIEIISPKLLEVVRKTWSTHLLDIPSKIDLDRDVLKPNISTGRIYAYDTPEYIKDMGTPQRFYETTNDILSGKVKARNLQNKQKAIFIDRDGTINKMVGFLSTPDKLELITGASQAIQLINKSGYLAIVITNQPVIARGECTFEQLRNIHNKMETELGKDGAFIDAIYVCPHHPDRGFPGEIAEYKISCTCRKPKPGLIYQAALDFNIDLSQSIVIGDSMRDVEAGRSAGCKTSILLETNKDFALLKSVTEFLDINEQKKDYTYNEPNSLS